MGLVVRAQSPFPSPHECVSAARAKPMRYGTSGIGSVNHLLDELLKIEGRAPRLDRVPCQGSAPACRTCRAVRHEGVFDPITTNVAALKAGSLRALAVYTPRRLAALPSIPTFVELGDPKLAGSQWFGPSAPKGLPAPIVPRLSALNPEVLARLEEQHTLPHNPALMGDDFVQLVRTQTESWRAVARTSNVEVIG